MPAFRHLLVLIAAAGAAAVFTAPSSAAVDQCPDPPGARPAMPHCIASQHFEVWYDSDTTADDYATATEASDVAETFEDAYATELGYGFPAPLNDGDGKVDVYIAALIPGTLGETYPDNPLALKSTGFIALDPSEIGADTELHVAAHELFHLIQFDSWVPQQQTDTWLFEGSAEWMGGKVDGFQDSDVTGIGPSDMSLDCRDNLASPPFQKCNPDFYMEGGYSRWPFFQYLAQRFGVTFVNSVFVQGGAGGISATTALQNALQARGTNLSDVYDDWSTVNMTGYGIDTLDAKIPAVYGLLTPGVATTTTPVSVHVNVDHLATRYIAFQRGNGDSSAPCFAATLSLTVAVPAGTSSKPVFYWNGPGGTAAPLSINGSTASASIPWDTCPWLSNEAYLSLPNASTTVDVADFVVTYSLTVDKTKAASPGTAPPPISVWGQVVPVTSAAVAPTVVVYGPELLKLSATDKQIRLIVESNADGSLQASLGSVALGSGTLRPGSNDLRFPVTAALLNSLRRSSAVANLLTLTPVSTDGVSKGTPVTRHVSIAPAKVTAKPKVKPKTKTKPKAKAKAKAKAKPKLTRK
jgi:hypothetical protein